MKFKKLFDILSPRFERRDLLDAGDTIFNQLSETARITQLEPEVEKMVDKYAPLLKRRMQSLPGFRGGVLAYIHNTAKARAAERAVLLDYAEKLYGKDVMKATFDYERMNVIALLNALSFFNSFVQDLTSLLSIASLNRPDLMGVNEKETMEQIALSGNIDAFISTIKAMQTPFDDLPKVFKNMRNIAYDSEDQRMTESILQGSSDPMRLGLMPVIGDFAFYIGTRYNRYVQDRNDLRKEEIARLEQTMAYLRAQRDGASEEELARIQKTIEYYSKRVQKLRAKCDALAEKFDS